MGKSRPSDGSQALPACPRMADSRTAPERGCPHPQHAKPPLAALHATARDRPDALRVKDTRAPPFGRGPVSPS